MVVNVHALAFAAAAAIALTQPSPAPAAIPAPKLEGITLGEDPAAVMRRFAVNPRTAQITESNGMKELMFSSTTDDADLTIIFDTRIRYIAALAPGKHSAGSDPFGIAFGDSPDRVERVRGKPDAITPQGDYYYESGGDAWTYEFQDGKLILISVSDL